MFAVPTGAVGGAAFDFVTRWRRSAPLLNVAAHLPARTAVDFLYQGGSNRLDGKVELAGVYAGTGAPADYAGVDARGKAVVIRRSDDVQSWDWIAPAQEAGAELLVVVNDRPGRLFAFAFGDLPVVSVTKAQGEALVSAAQGGKLTLRGEATAFPAYMYDLASRHQGFPTDLAYAPRPRDLAQVDHRFLGPEGAPLRGSLRLPPYLGPPCWGGTSRWRGQSTRTDYVRPPAVPLVPGCAQHRRLGTAARPGDVRAGQRTSLDWLAPITRPRLGPGYWGPTRDGDYLTINVPVASSGSRVTGHMWERRGTVTSRLYFGGRAARRVAVPGGLPVRADAGPGGVPLRAGHDPAGRPVEDVDRDAHGWTFQSQQTAWLSSTRCRCSSSTTPSRPT